MKNSVREIRLHQLLTQAQLAQKAGLSERTVGRVEAGRSCRLSTQRKILLALGRPFSDRDLVFPRR